MTNPGFPKSKNLPGGRGSALKPSHEPIVVARKPLAGTLEANAERYGTGPLWIDRCRIAGPQDPANMKRLGRDYTTERSNFGDVPMGQKTHAVVGGSPAGRWPSNVVLCHVPGPDGCRRVGERRVKSPGGAADYTPTGAQGPVSVIRNVKTGAHHGDADGMETVEAWECVDGCVVRALDLQAGERPGASSNSAPATDVGFTRGARGMPLRPGYGDSGSASRFFLTAQHQPEPRFLYAAKASSAERNAGLDGFEPSAREDQSAWAGECNVCGSRMMLNGKPTCGHDDFRWTQSKPTRNPHPTVKPVAVMRWLVRLVTPPGGLVLDPFAGSGTTGCAAALEGVRFVGIEKDPEYARIAVARIAWWRAHPDGVEIVERLASERQQARVRDTGQGSLFDMTAEPPAPKLSPNGRDGEATAEKRYTSDGASNFAMKPGRRRAD